MANTRAERSWRRDVVLIALLALWIGVPLKAAGQAAAQTAELEEAKQLGQQVAKLYREGKYDVAIPLAERALAIRENALGPEHSDVAASLSNLSALHFVKGDYARAEPLMQRALAIYEKTLGAEHNNVAIALINLANLYLAKADYARAEPLYQRALAIREKAFGAEHPNVAQTLGGLAALYDAKGDYARAESLYQRALAIREKSLGAEHPDVANSLNGLASLYVKKGDITRAVPLHQRALVIREKALGAEHPNVAESLHNLAMLYLEMGDYSRAEPLFQRSLAIWEKALGAEHPNVAQSLNGLAQMYQRKGDNARAEPLMQRSLAILEKTLGAEHPAVASSLTVLAALYYDKGDNARAEPLFLRALAIYEKTLGAEHADAARPLSYLAALYLGKGDYGRAEPLYQRSLAIFEKTLGAGHPMVAFALYNLSWLYAVQDKAEPAVKSLQRADDLQERNLALVLSTGSEKQKLLYVEQLSGDTDRAISLHFGTAQSSAQAAHLALTTILRRKGRALDAMTDQIAALRHRFDPQDRAVLDLLSAARAKLSTLSLGEPGRTSPAERQASIARLEAEVERLEAVVSARSAEFRVQAQPVTDEQVQKAIPAGAALVEIIAYHPVVAKAASQGGGVLARRYAAYVLHQTGGPLWADLGWASDINRGVDEFRAALIAPGEGDAKQAAPKDVRQAARALDEIVMRPVRRLLGDTRHVLLSPDGALNLVPFGALVDEQNRFLVETYSITYLTSGRDLLRLQAKSASRQAPLVIANPTFDLAGASSAQPAPSAGDTRGQRAVDFSLIEWPQLKGTAQEAAALKSILSGAQVLTDGAATESVLKHAAAPRILHVSTHGFFLPDKPQESNADAAQRGIKLSMGEAPASAHTENLLLRSGLALAGANKLQGGDGEDGILTALEAAGLDLWGTQLVVLSACETGVGNVRSGDGVYGLRRALVLAGSESQVMSLWKVDDAATRDLMVAYYKRLQAGEGRTEALRQVQLEMLASARQGEAGQERGLQTEASRGQSADRSHPYFWASFIQSGDWRGLDAQPMNIRK
jgi:CHAT domain-containing protein/tetratricopeptide (TPR) repeat protein